MAQPNTALSPEWDRWFDETFTDLISSDADLTRAEFDALIAAAWPAPPAPSDTSPHERVEVFDPSPDISGRGREN